MREGSDRGAGKGRSGASMAAPVVVAVDAMGGDRGPAEVVGGCISCLKADPALAIRLAGPQATLERLLAEAGALSERVTLVPADGVVTMEDRPSHVMRHGQGTSMWETISAVRQGQAQAAVSCGNTGALTALAMLQLGRLAGVNRPAIACLWPSRGVHGFTAMLDVGADVRAEPTDLLTYAILGAAYFRNGFAEARPRVGLLNVGTEAHKGRAEIREASELIASCAEIGRYTYLGFVEGSDIPSGRVDVVVTDGFTGNVALKTGEGTARLIGDFLRESFRANLLSRFGAALARRSLLEFSQRIDPRRVNGGVFLGLNGTVVKSHGAADATGVAAAVSLAAKLARSGYLSRVGARLANAATTVQALVAARGESG